MNHGSRRPRCIEADDVRGRGTARPPVVRDVGDDVGRGYANAGASSGRRRCTRPCCKRTEPRARRSRSRHGGATASRAVPGVGSAAEPHLAIGACVSALSTLCQAGDASVPADGRLGAGLPAMLGPDVRVTDVEKLQGRRGRPVGGVRPLVASGQGVRAGGTCAGTAGGRGGGPKGAAPPVPVTW